MAEAGGAWSAVERTEIPPATLGWLRDAHPGRTALFDDPLIARRVATLTHASRFLSRLLISDSSALDVIINPFVREQLPALENVSRDDAVRALVGWKQRELLRIAVLDVTEGHLLDSVGAAIAQLADDVLTYTHELIFRDPSIVIIGMGKLGGGELNYSSDIDIMFCGNSDEAQVREALSIIGRCFRTDMNLRPEGRDGALIRSLDSYQQYWNRWAQPWEFQALIKARAITGDPELCTRVQSAIADAVWTRTFDADELRSLRLMKQRTEDVIDMNSRAGHDLKRGRGGIRDIEFSLQLLQLVHGRNDTTLRSPNTLRTLDALSDGGYINTDDAESLANQYRFLRTVEHRLQLVDEQQTHELPVSPDDIERLAQSLGYDGDDASTRFDADIRNCQRQVREIHERMYFRPLLDAFASHTGTLPESTTTQLRAFGFRDATRTRAAIEELTRGLARSSRLMTQLMPLLLEWISQSPNPDEGLLGLRNIISGFRTPDHVIAAFRESPQIARRLCHLLGTTPLFGRAFLKNPELLDELGSDDALPPSEPISERLNNGLKWQANDDERHQSLIRLVRLEQTRIAIAEIIGVCSSLDAARHRSALADAAIETALGLANAPDSLAVFAMGRYGGSELGYRSDLDVIAVCADESQVPDAIDAITRVIGLLGDADPQHRLYDVDLGLRPEGRDGSLVRSVASYENYYTTWVSPWERQALIRARAVAGSRATAEALQHVIDTFVWDHPLNASDVKEFRILKARMERERIPRGEDPQFHLKLGPGSLSDVEWTTQLLQLQHHCKATSTVDALNMLRDADAISESDVTILTDAWVFCDRVRNRAQLISATATNSLPTHPESLRQLSRSLDDTNLRESYQRVTRRARQVMERLFYGSAESAFPSRMESNSS